MDNDLLNKCVAQGNGLVKICTALHERLAKLEAQNAKLVQINTALVNRVAELEKLSHVYDEAIAALPKRIDDITQLVNNIADNAAKPKTAPRSQRTYKEYKLVMDSLNSGKTMKATAKDLGISASTVSAYARMNEDVVAQLPRDDSDEYEMLPPEQVVDEAVGELLQL